MAVLTDRCVFDALAEAACTATAGPERVSLFLEAESSDFIRFNRGAVRQATHVDQGEATLTLSTGQRRIEATFALTGRLDDDVAALRAERTALAAALADVPEDPYLLLPQEVTSSERHDTGDLPGADAVIAAVTAATRGLDFVGFHAGGPVVRAYADSGGQRHWHHVESFHLEGCIYRERDQAIKQSLGGTHWDEAAFDERIATAAARLPLLALPPRVLQPGAWRTYFTPVAMAELLGTLAWGGFGTHARRTGTSSLDRLARGAATLHPGVHLAEDTARGIAPAFTADGFAKPACIPLVEGGRASGSLGSPRSARQYGVPANAGADEEPESLRLAPGALREADALAALDRGLYVSNLWYLNYSDRQACRMTGMTRFACFWVEDGRMVAPMPVMRFDDSFLRMAGAGLVGLTDRAELIPESSTYRQRHLRSVTTPGALVEGWRLVL